MAETPAAGRGKPGRPPGELEPKVLDAMTRLILSPESPASIHRKLAIELPELTGGNFLRILSKLVSAGLVMRSTGEQERPLYFPSIINPPMETIMEVD